MAYKKCTDNILFLLKYKYPNKVWNKTREDKIIILFEKPPLKGLY